ncbi:MAG: tyrosine kinase-domain-containing protein [Monoraphidium minutum]|nr:MAG: tyrosine kinase-domain-containing protein [Monoraphidium minutum]
MLACFSRPRVAAVDSARRDVGGGCGGCSAGGGGAEADAAPLGGAAAAACAVSAAFADADVGARGSRGLRDQGKVQLPPQAQQDEEQQHGDDPQQQQQQQQQPPAMQQHKPRPAPLQARWTGPGPHPVLRAPARAAAGAAAGAGAHGGCGEPVIVHNGGSASSGDFVEEVHGVLGAPPAAAAAGEPIGGGGGAAAAAPSARARKRAPPRASSQRSLKPKYKVAFEELVFHETIGKGSYKTVYRGRWANTNVAIVRMRRGGSVTEARMMQQLSGHPNLMCEQIAAAMAALAREGVIHRDLAVRNVLVQSIDPVHVKVSDFGLARETYARSRRALLESLPVRWAPPEVILRQEWGHASDAWAFGVAMWELWANGAEPYAALSNEQVVRAVLSGHRLERPPKCPHEVYALMQACWAPEPRARPSFDDLCDRFTSGGGAGDLPWAGGSGGSRTLAAALAGAPAPASGAWPGPRAPPLEPCFSAPANVGGGSGGGVPPPAALQRLDGSGSSASADAAPPGHARGSDPLPWKSINDAVARIVSRAPPPAAAPGRRPPEMAAGEASAAAGGGGGGRPGGLRGAAAAALAAFRQRRVSTEAGAGAAAGAAAAELEELQARRCCGGAAAANAATAARPPRGGPAGPAAARGPFAAAAGTAGGAARAQSFTSGHTAARLPWSPSLDRLRLTQLQQLRLQAAAARGGGGAAAPGAGRGEEGAAAAGAAGGDEASGSDEASGGGGSGTIREVDEFEGSGGSEDEDGGGGDASEVGGGCDDASVHLSFTQENTTAASIDLDGAELAGAGDGMGTFALPWQATATRAGSPPRAADADAAYERSGTGSLGGAPPPAAQRAAAPQRQRPPQLGGQPPPAPGLERRQAPSAAACPWSGPPCGGGPPAAAKPPASNPCARIQDLFYSGGC